MQVTLLKGKIHRATVTQADLHYEGSISIDADLMEAAGLMRNEQVDVLNITNGERLTTYVIQAPAGSGIVTLNGAAARRVQPGDMVIICAYAMMDVEEAKTFQPKVVLVDQKNKPKKILSESGHSGEDLEAYVA